MLGIGLSRGPAGRRAPPADQCVQSVANAAPGPVTLPCPCGAAGSTRSPKRAASCPADPDRAATLIVELPVLEPAGMRLRGPGIADEAALSLPEVAAFQANRALFPLGFDAFFTAGTRIAGLPRSTIVEDV